MRRVGSVLGGFGLLIGLLAVPAVSAVEAGIDVDAETGRALALASESGEPVVVEGLTTPTQQVWAQPGGSMRAEVSPVPVRVERDGTWQDVDLTLVERSDGSVGPSVAPVDLSLSGGGEGPLVELADVPATAPIPERDDNGEIVEGPEQPRFGLTWRNGDLPEPVLDGRFATYAEVVPGVDLVVEAGSLGFSTYFVVKSAEAAASPEVAELELGLAGSEELSVESDVDGSAGGGLLARDGSGRVVFSSPAARMWDQSEAPAGRGAGIQAADGAEQVVTERQGARSAPVAVEVAPAETGSGETLRVVPDADLLSDPDAVFPLVVDPAVSISRRNTYWTMVWSNGYTFPNSSEKARVGYDGWSGQNKKSRVFYRFNVSALAGKKILGAELLHKQTHSPSYTCGGTGTPGVQVYRSGGISSSTSWPGPAVRDVLDTSTVTHGHRNSCPGSTTTEWDVTPGVENRAAARSASLTLGMRSANESDEWGWRNFVTNDSYPVLRVDYNSKPNRPSAVRINDPSTRCVSDSGSAPAISSLQPRLQAKLTDPDGSRAELIGRFQVWDVARDEKVWSVLTPSPVPSGTVRYATVDAGALSSNRLYRFRVQARETVDGQLSVSSWSAWCYFRPDITRPKEPVVTSTDYPEHDPQSDALYGGVGQTGQFRIAARDGDVVEYRVRINGRPWQTLAAPSPGAAITVGFWPDHVGINILRAYAVDGAGNRSTTLDYHFNVAPGSAPVGWWRLDETSGQVAADSSANSRQLATAGQTWNALGRDNGSVRLTGQSGQGLAASGAAVSTFNSFTVAAWVRLEDDGANQTVVRQVADGDVHEFLLYYSATENRWGFQKQSQANPGFAGTAYSSEAPVIGSWTHLAGVFDAADNKLLLYVNGVLDGEYQMSSGTWFANGTLEIGTWSYNGSLPGVPLFGRVDDVRVWDRWLAPGELEPIVNMRNDSGKPEPATVAWWRFDETRGDWADSSGYGLTLTPSGGAQVINDTTAGRVLKVDGTSEGYARTSALRSVVDPAGSFTITAWIKPSSPSGNGTAISAGRAYGDNQLDTYRFGNNAIERWKFGRWNNAGTLTRVLSDEPISDDEYGEWRHVAAVYDRPVGRMYLYVDGVRQADVDGQAMKDPFGLVTPTVLGRAWVDPNDSFAGRLDDVRLHAGVMTRYDIAQQIASG